MKGRGEISSNSIFCCLLWTKTVNEGVEVKVGTHMLDVLPRTGNTELRAQLGVSETNDIYLELPVDIIK